MLGSTLAERGKAVGNDFELILPVIIPSRRLRSFFFISFYFSTIFIHFVPSVRYFRIIKPEPTTNESKLFNLPIGAWFVRTSFYRYILLSCLLSSYSLRISASRYFIFVYFSGVKMRFFSNRRFVNVFAWEKRSFFLRKIIWGLFSLFIIFVRGYFWFMQIVLSIVW